MHGIILSTWHETAGGRPRPFPGRYGLLSAPTDRAPRRGRAGRGKEAFSWSEKREAMREGEEEWSGNPGRCLFKTMAQHHRMVGNIRLAKNPTICSCECRVAGEAQGWSEQATGNVGLTSPPSWAARHEEDGRGADGGGVADDLG